jgi:ATP-binding cassette, subfamily F, member 3
MNDIRGGKATMLVAQVESISVSYGARKILDNLSWSIMDGQKIGLVGPNGAGKSTLLRILAGTSKPDEGERTIRRGAKIVYLQQEFTDDSPNTNVLSEVIRGREDLLKIEVELEQVEKAIADPESADDMDEFTRLLDRQAELIEQFESSGGPRFRSDAESMLQRLGIPDEMFETPITLLSGGQRKLVGLARCLVQEPDLLLLDEPDNHLDVTGKERLEQVVRSFSGAVIIISHDRYLLDETISQIVELDQAQLTVYEGNYSAYVKQRELMLLKQQQDFVAQQKEIQRLEEAISRFKQWASQVIDKRHIRQA